MKLKRKKRTPIPGVRVRKYIDGGQVPAVNPVKSPVI